jgi:hypothetical protein
MAKNISIEIVGIFYNKRINQVRITAVADARDMKGSGFRITFGKAVLTEVD